MKINKNSFELNEKAEIELDSSDNEGLINIPKNFKISAEIENYLNFKIPRNMIVMVHSKKRENER